MDIPTNKIYIIQMHTRTKPAKVIKLFTHYQYSHVAISLSKDCYETYSFGRKSLHNILNGGFVKEHKDGQFFNYFNETVCRIYELEVTEEKYSKIKKRLKFVEKHSKLFKYDYLGLLLNPFNIHFPFKNKFVCTSFVASLLEQTGIYKFDKDPCFVRPIDYEGLKGAKQIYLGKYKDYVAS